MIKSKSGFTIVELLIAIVVIAILAAITIVAYNGVQERARQSGAQNYAAQLKKRDLADAVGYWSFNECSGSTIRDSSGSGTNQSLTASGAVGWSTDTPTGSGCSVSLNGSTFFTTDIALTNTYYLKAAWIKTAATSSAMNIISDRNGASNNSAFFLNGLKISAGHNGSWSQVVSSASLNDNKWHYVAVEYSKNDSGSNGTLRLSVDGVVVTTNTSVPFMNNTSSVMAIGTFGGGSNYSGLLDDIMIVVR